MSISQGATAEVARPSSPAQAAVATRPNSTSKRNQILVALLAFLGLGVAGFAIYKFQKPVVVAPGMTPFASVREQSEQVPVLFKSPSFSFVDQEGRGALDTQLRGKIWIADFIFTNCGGQCPKVTAKMVELQKAIDNPDVRFVSFSVDPDRDDPQTLKRYAQRFNAGDSRWMLLRPPDRKTIMNTAKHMAALAPSPDAEDSIVHTDSFVLIDGDGKVRGLYDSKDPKTVEKLKSDFAKVARQQVLDQAAARTSASPKPAH